MTKDEIISMAREAGIDEWWDNGSDWRETFDDVIERFAQLVAKHTQEQCAKVCDEQQKEPECPERAAYCAEAIRNMTV